MNEEIILSKLEDFLEVHGHWITHLSEACIFMFITIIVIILMIHISRGSMRSEIDYALANPKTLCVVKLVILIFLIVCIHYLQC